MLYLPYECSLFYPGPAACVDKKGSGHALMTESVAGLTPELRMDLRYYCSLISRYSNIMLAMLDLCCKRRQQAELGKQYQGLAHQQHQKEWGCMQGSAEADA